MKCLKDKAARLDVLRSSLRPTLLNWVAYSVRDDLGSVQHSELENNEKHLTSLATNTRQLQMN